MKLHFLLLFSFCVLSSFSGLCQSRDSRIEAPKTEYVILQYSDGFGTFDKSGKLRLIKESKVVNLENVPEFSAYNSESSKIAENDQLILAGLRFLTEKHGYELVSSMAYLEAKSLVKEFVMRK
jgi:hypothetical protein